METRRSQGAGAPPPLRPDPRRAGGPQAPRRATSRSRSAPRVPAWREIRRAQPGTCELLPRRKCERTLRPCRFGAGAKSAPAARSSGSHRVASGATCAPRSSDRALSKLMQDRCPAGRTYAAPDPCDCGKTPGNQHEFFEFRPKPAVSSVHQEPSEDPSARPGRTRFD